MTAPMTPRLCELLRPRGGKSRHRLRLQPGGLARVAREALPGVAPLTVRLTVRLRQQRRLRRGLLLLAAAALLVPPAAGCGTGYGGEAPLTSVRRSHPQR